MPRGIPHTTYGCSPLPRPLQPRFDALVERVGVKCAARLLSVGDATIEKLLHGGAAQPEAVARVAVKLEEVERDARR